MTRDDFKILHSELIMYCQCIEFDLKRIYSGMSEANFDDTMDMLENSNLGRTLKKLKTLDFSDGTLDLSESLYEDLNEVREIRNYLCHQCYIDFIYIENAEIKENEFQMLSRRLENERNRLYNIHRVLERIYLSEYDK